MVFYRSAATSKLTKPQWKTIYLRIFEQHKLVLIGFKIIIINNDNNKYTMLCS